MEQKEETIVKSAITRSKAKAGRLIAFGCTTRADSLPGRAVAAPDAPPTAIRVTAGVDDGGGGGYGRRNGAERNGTAQVRDEAAKATGDAAVRSSGGSIRRPARLISRRPAASRRKDARSGSRQIATRASLGNRESDSSSGRQTACDMLAENGFKLTGACASGASGLSSAGSGLPLMPGPGSGLTQDHMNPRSSGDYEEQRWAHYTEFVFYREANGSTTSTISASKSPYPYSP
uniref:KCTD8/12/16 H1 domain-containing protein n=1 Tax=Plectus sambesii TaxID=2011161 RepID=A0A914WNQ1_9BILA